MADVSHWALSEIVAKAVRAVSSPKVNIGPALGLKHSLHVGLADLDQVLQSGETRFVLEWDEDAAVSVKRQDGGVIATLAVRF